jgi:plasmid stabilization system protein ParE
VSTYRVIVLPEVEGQVEAIKRWWKESGLGEPTVLLDELETLLARLSHLPELGSPYPRVPTFRRWLVRGTRYYVYYMVDDSTETVVVAAIWHNARGVGPPL